MRTSSRSQAVTAAGRLLAAVAGLMLPLAFAPFGLHWLLPLLLAALFMSWRTSAGEAAGRGFLFGACAFGAGTWWLYVSVRLVGGTPLPVAVLLLAGLVIVMAAWYALCAYLSVRWSSGSLVFDACVLLPALWVLTEWLRGWLFTGFPWLAAGYAAVDGPLGSWAPLAGVYGASLATALLAGALVTLLRGRTGERVVSLLLLLVVAAGTWLLGGQAWTVPLGEPLRVSLVQGAVPQLLKWDPAEQIATMEHYFSTTAELGGRDLIVWPEAAIPAPDDWVPEYLEDLRVLADELGTQLLTGILTHDVERDEYRNSLLALGADAGVYHKRHLVPFGEFFPVPAFVRSWMRMANLPFDDITPGDAGQALLRVGNVPIAPTICYEDAYGAEQLGFLPEAQLLVNVSNDAWFGDTIAPHQHLQMARMRALETGRFMVRSTNTGITAIIDQKGRLLSVAPQFEATVLDGLAQPYGGATPYVRMGNLPVVLFGLLAVAVTLLARRYDKH